MTDLHTEQKQRAEDLARGIILAQISADPSLDLRGLLDSQALYSVPHRDKVEALRQYAVMAATPEFQGRINMNKSIPREVWDITRNTALEAMRTGAVGAGVVALASPKIMEALSHGGGARKLVLTSLAKPALFAAGIGGALRGYHEISERKRKREYTRETQEILENIRQQENPNPYINALMLTNRNRLMEAKAAIDSVRESHDRARELLPAGLAVASSALPGKELMFDVAHRAFSPLSDLFDGK